MKDLKSNSRQFGMFQKFLLGIFFIQRRNKPFFENGGKVSASIAVKCLGTRCESGTVAPL
jgi:hypothetical protein